MFMDKQSKISNKSILAIALGMAIAGMSASTSAQVNLLTDDASLHQNHEETFFSQKGISGESFEPVDAAGVDMSLALATSILIPKNWKIQTSGDFQGAVVSWKGGVTWPLILKNISHNEEIYISLDWVRKIASINVPGKTKSEIRRDIVNNNNIESEMEEYSVKNQKEWSKRNDDRNDLERERNQIDMLIEKQRKAQESNQKLIAQLNDINSKFTEDNAKLKSALEAERVAKENLIEKYSVITPSLKDDAPEIDATELFKKHQDRWVLPFDSSFDYFMKGGHADNIDYVTPATFIAKAGSIEEVVGNWASELNWHIEYRAGVQHYNPYQVELKGSFIEASTQLISIFKDSDRPLNITYHPDVVIGNKKGLVTITDLNFQDR